ncbi:MAG: hypothetical protein ABWZ98_16560 [Nakamurella sp.]
MKTSLKIGGFALGLAALFGAAFAVGGAVGPSQVSAAETADHDDPAGQQTAGSHADQPGAATAAELPGGLLSAQDGYTLKLGARVLPAGPQVPVDFQIIGPDALPVTDYQVAHDKELHLIVIRRDLTGFQHLHPSRAVDGTWRAPVDLSVAGAYRVFADFAPAGHDGITLGADLAVPGSYAPHPLSTESRVAEADGYTVTLDGELVAGQSSKLVLTVARDGVPVTDLQPYLAAFGHLVALRDGDLAYLHVHPAGAPGDGVTPAGPGITFYATIPSAGTYGLFLDFQHDGVVRTAAFTANAQPAAVAAATAEPAPGTAEDGHGH